MDKKSKIVLVLLVITLLSLSSYASLSRFSKGINKEGSINTTEMEYCKLNEIETLSECLIRNDSKQELSLALNTIDERTSLLNLNNVEPMTVYSPSTAYTDIPNKTNTTSIVSTSSNTFTYVIESKLIDPFDVNDSDITKIKFDSSSGRYTYTNSITGNVNDIVTTPDDIASGIYKYTCLNTTTVGDCEKLYLFTEDPYMISGSFRFKQGYSYSFVIDGTSSFSNEGLYKGEDDYTVDNDNYTYFYRGDVNNNWVKFGNYLWRIVRINGNGTIRMIYSGLASASNHTGGNAHIMTSSYGDVSPFTTRTTDLYDSSEITMTYSNGLYGTTYVGYMYNPTREIATYPNIIPDDTTTARLDKFPAITNISNSKSYYFFKDFNASEDCFTGDDDSDNGTCVLTCRKLGNDGEENIDCVYSNWNILATREGNYSETAPGVYPPNNPTQYIYTGDYKYTCWTYSTPVIKENADGTTSVYVACPVVSEIVGTLKGELTQAKVKYHGLFSQNIETSNSNVKDSGIKKQVDSWYVDNIMNKNDGNNHALEDYLSDAMFCNDRSSISSEFPFANANAYIFGPYSRNLSRNRAPSFKCPNISNDAFTLKTSGSISSVEASGIGNNMLTYPVGLITIDEVAFAGGKNDLKNYKYYLYTGNNYWTMSPFYFNAHNIYANTWYVNNLGELKNQPTYVTYGVRPVINLKSDVLYKGGNGTESNPYIIDVKN